MPRRNGLKVFISHHHEEKRLAKAWQTLISNMTQSAADPPWYSSDERAAGGMDPGEWRKQVYRELKRADVLLVLLTRVSNEQPWLFYESGLAVGQNKEVVPVCYFMDVEDLSGVFRAYQCYQGDRLEGANGVKALCAKLLLRHLGNEASLTPWMPAIDLYMAEIKKEQEDSFTRNLFQDHFHNYKAAAAMEGLWFAKWTQTHADRREEVFEVDTLTMWTTENRLRVVGLSQKAGQEFLDIKASGKFYPMEGVVHKSGLIALSDWSGGNIPICGTALLAPRGATGGLLEGTWQGITAKNLSDTPSFAQGRVVIARKKEMVDRYWPEIGSSSSRAED